MVFNNHLYPHHPQMPQPPLTNTKIHDIQPQPHLHPQPCPQPPPYTEGYPQPQPQPHPQPQAQPQPQPHSQPHPLPQGQLQHPFIQPMMGQLHLQSQPHQQMPPVTPYHPLHVQPQYQGSSPGMGHPVQVESQFPLQQKCLSIHHAPLQHAQQMVLLPMTGQHPHIPPVQQSLSVHHAGQQIHHQPGMLLPLQRPLLQKFPQQDAHSAVHQSQLLPLQRPLLQKFPQQHAHSAGHQSQLSSVQGPCLVHAQKHQQRTLASVHPSQPRKSLCPQSLPSAQQHSHFHPQLQQQSHVPFAQLSSSGIQSNTSGVNRNPGRGVVVEVQDTVVLHGLQEERFKYLPEEHAGVPLSSSFPVVRGGSPIQSAETGDRLGSLSFRDSLGKNTDQWHVSEFGQLRLEKMSPARSLGWESSGLPLSGLGSSSAGPGLGRQMRRMQMSEVQFGGGFQMHVSQGSFQGDMERFDHSRKRKPGSMEWCRICNVDCKTVEGIELHSQTKEHQKMEMEMEMARSIERDSAEKHKLSSQEHASHEAANKAKKGGHRRRS